MTVADHVRLAAQAAAGGSYRMWRRAADYRERVASVLERTGLAAPRPTPAGALSHGEKRKVELAVLLVGEPRLMLLDEPMAGVSAEDVPALTDADPLAAPRRGPHRADGRAPHGRPAGPGRPGRRHAPRHPAGRSARRSEVMADATVQQAYLGEAL